MKNQQRFWTIHFVSRGLGKKAAIALQFACG